MTVPAGGKAGQLLNVRVPQQRPIVVQQPGQTIVVQDTTGQRIRWPQNAGRPRRAARRAAAVACRLSPARGCRRASETGEAVRSGRRRA